MYVSLSCIHTLFAFHSHLSVPMTIQLLHALTKLLLLIILTVLALPLIIYVYHTHNTLFNLFNWDLY